MIRAAMKDHIQPSRSKIAIPMQHNILENPTRKQQEWEKKREDKTV
jgi:hypothetical protein